MSESDKLVYTLSVLKGTASDDIRKKELNEILTRLLAKMGKKFDNEDTDIDQ